MSRKDKDGGVVGLDRVVSVSVAPPNEGTQANQEPEDWFDLEDLEIWALLPDAVSLMDSSLEELSIGTEHLRRLGN